MKPSDSNDERNDPAWELLRSARRTEASPVFVQNTVRRVRQLSSDAQEGSIFVRCLNLLRRPAFALPLTAAAVVGIAAIVATSNPATDDGDDNIAAVAPPAPAAATTTIDEAPAAAPEVEYTVTDQLDDIDYLGELVAVTDPGTLNEQMLADLLYY